MAKDFPNSKFYGIDINNTFPEEFKPGNCDFVLGNISEEIPFPDNTFDYIHQRLLVLGLTSEMWERVSTIAIQYNKCCILILLIIRI